MTEFHERFRLNKTQAQLDRGISTDSESTTLPIIDDTEVKPSRSFPKLLIFSLLFNVALVYILSDVVVMYASPEHTLWKVRNSTDHNLPKAFIESAKNEVCK